MSKYFARNPIPLQEDLLPIGILHNPAEKIAQRGNHVHSGVISFLAYEAGDAVKRIEQKMRLDLAAKSVKLRPGELLVQTSGFRLLERQSFPRFENVAGQKNGGVQD